jgi:chemosensory pili system protein ChpA (sensor histidine kinase/response regulator)
MTNQSSLVWLVDEVQVTLESLQSALEPLNGWLDMAAPEDYQSRLVVCEEKIHSIAGAFDVAACEPLSKYAVALGCVLQLWRESPEHFDAIALSHVRSAIWSLSDFLRIAKHKPTHSELSLFTHYQHMGALLSTPFHPIELWSSSERQEAIQSWSNPDVVKYLQQLALDRHSSGIWYESLHDQVDALMLGLIRYKKSDSAAELQLLCDWHIAQKNESKNVLQGSLLSVIIDALSRGQLDLDIFLKRFLLGSMAWLKGIGGGEDQMLSEATFFTYVAWQRQTSMETNELDRLASWAKWSLCEGCNYIQTSLGSVNRDQVLLTQKLIDTVQQQWDIFCANEAVSTPQSQMSELALLLDSMGVSLVNLHASAHALHQALQRVVVQTGLQTSRDVQIEVATTLLTLRSMVAEMHAAEDSEVEGQFADLTRRLTSVCNGQSAGAFEPWMVDLQQRQNWMDAMSSSIEHLGQKLNEIENIFKLLWDHPLEKAALGLVPEKLQQISSVASSLGLFDFAAAVPPVAKKIQALLVQDQSMDLPAQQQLTHDFAKLGLMLNMWAHESVPMTDLTEVAVPESALIDSAPSISVANVGADDQDESMTQIFLDEASAIFPQAHLAVDRLRAHSDDVDAFAILKRSFHTLKGSARIVGLMEFGEAAWLLERYLNDSLTEEQQPMTAASLNLCADQLRVMQSWAQQLQNQKIIDVTDIDWDLDSLAQAIQNLERGAESADEERQLKTIGELEISIPLYQAYLNETDEWSRQLALVLSEWAMDDRQPIPGQTLTWAHALAGSSATIGFTGCAQLAKLVERLVEKIEAHGLHFVDLAQTLSLAADEIRRLLHQFAAGFMKEPDPKLLEKMNAYLLPLPTVATESVALPEPVQTAQDAEMLSVFHEESAQLIPELGAALRAWDKTQALRVLHTLKGSARLVGEQVLAQRVHKLESDIEAIGDKPDGPSLSKLLASYDQLLEHLPVPAERTAIKPTHMPFVAIVPSGETIRVQSSTVDRLVNQTGEIMIARARMESEMSRSLRTLADSGVQVQRLRDQLRELELQTESQMQSRQAQVSDAANSFDPLELDRFTRTQELTRFMAETLSDVSTLQRSLQRSLNATEDDLAAQLRQTRDLQRHLLRTRMVEFESISERLHRLVRMTCQELGKSVELTIQNGGQEMDRSVLERVLPAFEHLLRNAVVHGIELPSVRESKGKSTQGKIDIQLTQQSNDVIVILKDDGQGINQEALLLKAKKLYPQANLTTDPTELIFMSGLSTASEVSELAGRGIGLDVVRAQVQALGGRIEVQFSKDAGTSFKLILPLTTAVTQIVLVRTGTLITGIPGNLIVTVVRAKVQDVLEAQTSGQFINGSQTYPFYRLNQLLQYRATAEEPEQATLPLLLLQSAGLVIALQVDEVLGNQEVMIKNLGAQLAHMPGLSGMTVLPTGATVLIYNPVALAAVYGSRIAASQKMQTEVEIEQLAMGVDAKKAQAQQQAPLILVVDDSITMRRVLQRLLQREGYRVSLAADGKQALDSLRLEKPVLVLSDVEMPRMDGFELLQNIRASDRLHELPVVMITSRIADKHREHAKLLGANEYLGKPYSEEELVEVLGRYAKK